MIFVTLGTQDKQFDRLLRELDRLIEVGYISTDVIVQAGFTKYTSKNMKVFDFISMDEFRAYVEKSAVVICHGGVGSILSSIQLRKKVIAVARLKEFNEHENDHQVEIVSRFDDLNYIIGCLEVRQMEQAFERLNEFKPSKYESNNVNFCNLIQSKIDELVK